MAMYQYKGRDRAGSLVTGNVEALSADAVATELFGRAVTPIEIREIKITRKAANDKSGGAEKPQPRKLPQPTLSKQINITLFAKKIEGEGREAAVGEIGGGSGQNMGVMPRVFCLRRSADHRELRPL